MKIQKRKLNSGFTIIEVMIVLAIAGLILAIIFLAVPALQRAARNNSRKNDASHYGGLVDQYESDNSGTLPTSVSANPQSTCPNATTLCTGGETWALAKPNAGAPLTPASFAGSTPALNVLYLYGAADCGSGATANEPVASSNPNDAVIFFLVEQSGGNVDQCIPV